jgi:large subunit ribosomal protein L21
MYAIIRTGGKQYKVQAGDLVKVEKLDRDLGAEFELNEVLAVGGDKVFLGEPVLKGAKVTVVVTRQAKAPKVIVFKKKRRQGYRRMRGHRQLFTELFVKSITTPEGQTVSSDSQPPVVDPEATKEKKAKKAAAPKKKVAKKAAPKKKVAKKAGKSAGKKKSATKKATTKKAAAKKTTKKASK